MHRSFAPLALLFLFPVFSFAQEAETTTEFGITITTDEIAKAIEETQEFWGPVRKHIGGNDFAAADAAARKKAVEFLKTVHNELHYRLMEADEATATDLVVYLTARLRKFEIYRKLRGAIADDAALVVLVERWEHASRDLNALPEKDRPAQLQALVASMPEEMQAAGISAEKIAAAQELWTIQAACLVKMTQTLAGKKMIEFEAEAKNSEKAVADLIRSVALAADWALIVKEQDQAYTKGSFVKAWDEIASMKAKRRTVSKPGTISK